MQTLATDPDHRKIRSPPILCFIRRAWTRFSFCEARLDEIDQKIRAVESDLRMNRAEICSSLDFLAAATERALDATFLCHLYIKKVTDKFSGILLNATF